MLAKDLIKILEKNPEWDVTVSVDISKGEDDCDRRAFGDDVIEVIEENNVNRYTMCFTGYDNHNETLEKDSLECLDALKYWDKNEFKAGVDGHTLDGMRPMILVKKFLKKFI